MLIYQAIKKLAGYRACLLSALKTTPFRCQPYNIQDFFLNWLPKLTMTYGIFVICSQKFFIYTLYTKDDICAFSPTYLTFLSTMMAGLLVSHKTLSPFVIFNKDPA
jgi:hypothetical protein